MIRYLAASFARITAACILTCGVALAQSAPAGEPSSVKLTTVISDIPAGTPVLSVSTGLICLRENVAGRAMGGREPLDPAPYAAFFKAEMEKAGFKVLVDDDLFAQEPASADYQVAAVISDEHVYACMSNGGLLHDGQAGDSKGNSSMRVDWQIYSPVRKEVVAHITTSGAFDMPGTTADGIAKLRAGAFASNVRELAANAQFRSAVNGLPLAKDTLTSGQSRIALAGSQKAAKRPIADAVGGVVTIVNGIGSGSGVLLSDDGYVLTNAHVVGEEKEVRIRWSDGIETPGQIIRVAKARDVALVKTNPRERLPLSIAHGAISPGQRVYAIGPPLGTQFAGSVSSGVISANRTIDGFRFIQSDVSISPGSSGGALLDESGALIGITVSQVEGSGAAGLNLFIPIGDAMDFLSLDQN